MNQLLKGLLLLAIPLYAGAQEMPDIEDQQASQDLAEQMIYLQEHPVNLNHADLDQLMTLPGITPYQALRLDRYLKSHPKLSDPLLLVRDSILDPQALESLLPYVCLDFHLPANSVKLKLSSRLQRKWPEAEGIAEGSFNGSPLESRTRMWFRPDENWEIYGQCQHDVGEPAWNDYYSGNLWWSDDQGTKQVIIGDYQMKIGQGLLFGGSSPRIFSSYWSGSAQLDAAAVRQYFSSHEYRGLRGLCLKHPLADNLNIICFASRRRMDAKIDSMDRITSIYDDGYHRSHAELERKNNSAETIIGGRVGFSPGRSCDIGITGYNRAFDKTTAEGLYNAFLVSLDARTALDKNWAWLELAKGEGAVGGYTGEVGFMVRDYAGRIDIYGYSPKFKPPRFNADNYFGGDDERGITIAGWYRAPLGCDISAIYNQFYPWQPFPLSSQGYRGVRYEARLDKKIFQGLLADLRIRSLQKEYFIDEQSGAPIYHTSNLTFKAGLHWRLGKQFSATGRHQASFFGDSRHEDRKRGELLSLALKAQLPRDITIQGQTVFYYAPSYDARLYLAEPELRSGGSFHGYWGLGRRDALFLRCALGRSGAGYLKIARQLRDYQGQVDQDTELGIELEFLLK
ncbi:MAG: helix-hairpin-helix domain-containing protein [Candidatus Edwardsbacteria bacterium]|nr:helix-hairpin-helix domain-containing protein [Candidatus Edwardsbacteria bacterium]